jgi:large subunit ribosomal protein L18
MPKTKIFKRYRRKEVTDYGKRLNLLKSGVPRLVVRVSSKNILAQLVAYSPDGDKILFAVSTKSVEKLGWKGSRNNLPAAYLLGKLLAKKTAGKIKEAILDIGKARSVAHSRVYSVVKGAIDGGIKIPIGDSAVPSNDRISGMHIKAYAEKLAKESAEKYKKVFSAYLSKGLKPETLPNHFNEIKAKVEGVK